MKYAFKSQSTTIFREFLCCPWMQVSWNLGFPGKIMCLWRRGKKNKQVDVNWCVWHILRDWSTGRLPVGLVDLLSQLSDQLVLTACWTYHFNNNTRKMPNSIKDVFFFFFFFSKKIDKIKKSAQEFGLEIRSGEITLKKKSYCFSCKWHSYLTWYMFLPNIIKLSQTVWELWPEQDFGFRGVKYIKQKLSFLQAPLLLDLIYEPTKYCQIISHSNGSYDLHKISISGEIST